MNKKTFTLILASSVLLSACLDEKKSNSTAAVSTVSKADAIAVVNGTFISKASLTALEKDIAQRSQGQSFPQEKLIQELVQRELLLQDAVKKNLDTTDEFTAQLATIRSSLLSQAAIQNHLKTNAISDADLEAEYNKNIADAGTEYKARHILLKTEEDAKSVIAELVKGADFATLAKSKSTGPSGPQGGDLGWFTGQQMVAPFSEAAIALEDGKFTTEPVKTQFGWHVILKEGSRAQTPPPFESIKEQIRPLLQRKKMQTYMDSLRQSSTIEVFLPSAEEKAALDATEKAAKQTTTTVPGNTDKAAEAPSETTQATETEEKYNATLDKAKAAVDAATEETKSKAVEAMESDKTIEKIVDQVKDVAKEKAAETTDAASKALDSLK